MTAGGPRFYTLSLAWKLVKARGWSALALRSVATTTLVLTFFQVFPHYPVGISEVHLILGSTFCCSVPRRQRSAWLSAY